MTNVRRHRAWRRIAAIVAILSFALGGAVVQASFTLARAKAGKRPPAAQSGDKITPAPSETAILTPVADATPTPVAAPVAAVPGGKRVALVIGVGGYANVPWLTNPPNDAKLIADALRRDGFTVVALTRPEELTRNALIASLNRFRAEASGAEAAVVYYAGHGVEVDGTNWLLPADTAAETPDDLEGTAIRASFVIKAVNGASKVRLVVLDACRNNPFARSRGWSTGTRAVAGGGLARQADLPSNVVLLLATQQGQTSADSGAGGATGNSPFARALAASLQKPGMTQARLPSALSQEMLAQSGIVQRPDQQGIIDEPDWQFVTAAPPATAATAVAPAITGTAAGGQSLEQYARMFATMRLTATPGIAAPASLRSYIEQLLPTVEAGGSPVQADRYFQALQMTGDTRVGREMESPAAAVSQRDSLGARVRDRDDLARRVTQLRDQLATLPADSQERAQLETSRGKAEAELIEAFASLGKSHSFALVDPGLTSAPLSDIQTALRPGEVYLKFAAVQDSMYAIAIEPGRVTGWRLTAPSAALGTIIDTTVRSFSVIDDRLVPFDVPASYTLYKVLFGPFADRIGGIRRIVYDPSGPLRNLPLTVLVTDKASVDSYQASRRAAPFDFSKLNFLGSRVEVSLAPTPSAFLKLRAEAPSRAPKQFIGLGANSLPSVAGSAADTPLPLDCGLTYKSWVPYLTSMHLDTGKELQAITAALGQSDAPMITGAAFTDTQLMAGGGQALRPFQVIHFASAAISESAMTVEGGCKTYLPAAIVTSLAPPNQPPVSDGMLSLEEIARLRLDANLVVIDGAQTGIRAGNVARRLTTDADPSTLDGLVRAFLVANTRVVLATYWPVGGAAETESLMGVFYTEARSKPIGAALRQAQMMLMHQPQYSHPFYWGGYFTAGDSDRPMLTTASATP